MIREITVRVYGLLLNPAGELLLSSEFEYGKAFTKFPGGGLEPGEGLHDALKREFMEETAVAVAVGELIYTNPHFVVSMFDPSKQVFVFHYHCRTEENLEHLEIVPAGQSAPQVEGAQVFHWVKPEEAMNLLTFETDRLAMEQFLQRF